jgi:hypothetical protein
MTMEIPNWDTVRIQDKSNILEVDLLYAEFSNEEYIHTETDESGIGVMWSSQLELSATIDAAHAHMGIAEDNDDYWSRVVFEDGKDQEMNPAKIEQIALTKESDVRYYTGAYGEGLLSWRRPQVKMKDGQILHAEICYTAEHPRLEAIVNLISTTATQQVVEAIKGNSDPLAQKVNLVAPQ